MNRSSDGNQRISSHQEEITLLRQEMHNLTADLVRQQADAVESRMEAAKRTRSIHAFQQLYDRILAAHDQAEIYQETVLLLLDIGFDRVVMYRKEDSEYIPIASNGYTSSEKARNLTSPPFASLLEKEKSLLINGSNREDFDYDYEEQLDLKYFVAVNFFFDPLEKVPHILLAGNKTEKTVLRSRLNEADLKILQTLTGQISVAVEKIGFLKRLQDSERKYRLLYENSIEGIFQIGCEQTFISANPAMARLLGYVNVDELLLSKDRVGDTFFVFPDQFDRLCRYTHSTGAILGLETPIRTRDGLERWVSMSAHCVKDNEGNPLYLEGSVVDITEKIKSKKLEGERKTAEEANRAKGQFLAHMSHEIRTPMNGVIGMADLLLRTSLDENQRYYAQTAYNCGTSLLTIIDDILDFSKIEAGKLSLEVIEFDIRHIMDELIDMMELKLEEKKLPFICGIDPVCQSNVVGDPGRLRQVFVNLVGNAIKFTEVGEVGLYATIKTETEEQLEYYFAVRDTGIGIEISKQQHLFTPFTQVDSTDTRVFGGTGLGLAICRQLVKLMGGEIGVTSREGEGCEFWFTVKFDKQKNVPPTDPGQEVCSGRKILIIEKRASQRRRLVEQLTYWGAEVISTPSGSKGFGLVVDEIHKNEPFDLVLTSLETADIDGVTLAWMLKNEQKTAQTAVTLMASGPAIKTLKTTDDTEFLSTLNSPIRFGELQKILLDLFSGSAPIIQSKSVDADLSIHTAETNSAWILIVEDNDINQQVVCGMLKTLGYPNVHLACHGQEALTLMKRHCYDIVLMDVQMPVLDGLETTRRIRSERYGINKSTLPIIALTAHALKSDLEQCLGAGMNDFMTKPVLPDTLHKTLQKWLGERSQGGGEPERSRIARSNIADYDPIGMDTNKLDTVPVFRYSQLKERMMDDDELTQKVIRAFLENFPDQESELEEAFSTENYEEFKKIVHTMKGSSGNIGAQRLQILFKELEGVDGSKDDVASLMGMVKQECKKIKYALENYLV